MKKHLKLFSLISLAIAGIGVSFAAIQRENISEKEIEKADAYDIPNEIYLTFDTPWTNSSNNNDIGGYSFSFRDSGSNYFPGGRSSDYAKYSISEMLNDPTSCYGGLEISNYDPNGLATKLGIQIIKITVPTSSNASFSATRFIAWKGKNTTGTQKQTELITMSNANGNWYVVTSCNGDTVQKIAIHSISELYGLENKASRIYIDLSASSWKDVSTLYSDNVFWAKFRGATDNKTTYSDTDQDDANLRIVSDFKVSTLYSNDRAEISHNYVCLSVPALAVSVEFKYWDWVGMVWVQEYAKIDILDKDNNLLLIKGSGTPQDIFTTTAPFSPLDKIYFKLTGSDWDGYSDSIRATFYGISGRIDSDEYAGTDFCTPSRTNRTTSSMGDLGEVVYDSSSNAYLSFDVPHYATHVAFSYNNDSSKLTSKMVLNPNGQRTFKYESSALSVEAAPSILKTAGETTASLSTARFFVSNTVYNGTAKAINSDSVWYGNRVGDGTSDKLGDKLAIQVWNDECLGPNPTYGSYIYYFSDRFDGGGSDSEGTATGNQYYYVNIPINMNYFRLVIMSATGRLSGASIKYGCSKIGSLDENAYSTGYYLYSINSTFTEFVSFDYGPIYDASKRATGDYHVGAAFMKAVLEGYDTCCDSKYNGYGNVTRIENNFYLNPTDTVKNTLVTTLELTSVTKAGLYSPATVQDILIEMNNRASGSGSSSAVRIPRDHELDSSRIVIIIVISSLSLMAFSIITLYINKKRKHS